MSHLREQLTQSDNSGCCAFGEVESHRSELGFILELVEILDSIADVERQKPSRMPEPMRRDIQVASARPRAWLKLNNTDPPAAVIQPSS